MSAADLLPYAEYIGAAAAVLTSASFLPQVWKTVRTRHADDFSWGWLAAFGAGVSLWGAYGVVIDAPSMVLNNIAVAACVVVMGWVKFSAHRR